MGIHIFGFLLKAFIVVVINFSLFLLIPISQRLMHGDFSAKGNNSAQRRIVAEVVKPEKQKQKQQKERRIRDVNTSQGRKMQNPMKFKLSPDLSVSSGNAGVAIRTNDSEAQVFSSDEVDQPATLVRRVKPRFPQQAKNLAVSGDVVVEFIVDVDGRVSQLLNIRAPHPSFKAEVREAIAQWKFKPARNQGVPVKQKVQIVIGFNLQD